MNGVQVVTIKEKKNLFTKDFSVANSIEYVTFNENGYGVVVQKGLYSVGDKGVFILPDFCVPDVPLFEEFLRPRGEVKNSKLGKVDGIPSRVRAVSFNMSLSSERFEKVYSVGILFPVSLVEEMYGITVSEEMNLDEVLGITKYIEPDTGMGLQLCPFPENMYMTDELNIKSYPSLFDSSKEYYITRKVDGSSITIMKSDKYPDGFISSRRTPQKIYDENGEILSDCGAFVTYGYSILKKLLNSKYNNIALRGELIGKGFKGSGNKNNSDAQINPRVLIYSVDNVDPVSNVAIKVRFNELIEVLGNLGVDMVEVLDTPSKFRDLEEVIETCKEHFEDFKDQGYVIEGCVVRSTDSTVSFKVMNDEYDSKK